MTIIESIMIFVSIILIYTGIVFLLHKKGILKKHNISFYGPALMWRTQKGIQFLKNRAQWIRFWRIYGNASIIFCLITMVLMTALMIWTARIVLDFTPEQRNALPGPEVALVLPGINPILPLEFLGYILLGLIIAIIVLGILVGAYYMQRAYGGRGTLMGGVSGVYAAKVVVLGAGVAGMNAATIALGMQAEVLQATRQRIG